MRAATPSRGRSATSGDDEDGERDGEQIVNEPSPVVQPEVANVRHVSTVTPARAGGLGHSDDPEIVLRDDARSPSRPTTPGSAARIMAARSLDKGDDLDPHRRHPDQPRVRRAPALHEE